MLLTLCQGLFFTNNVTFIAINGLVGLQLAPLGWMATLPIMAYVGGGALAAPLVARHQRRFGPQTLLPVRARRGDRVGGAVRAGRHAAQLSAADHGHGAGGLLQRQRRAVPLRRPSRWSTPAHKERAISWVLAGGILGGVFGPNLATATRDLLPQPFAGAYVALDRRGGCWPGW